MEKVYNLSIVRIHNGDKQCVKNCKVDKEDLAVKEYFKLERKANELRSEYPNDEIDLLFEVDNLDDHNLNSYEKYNFFSIIQGIKDKGRLPFGV